MRRYSSSGQGSLEYLLLIGAGALVALLAFLLLLFLGPYGGLLFEQNVDEYEKIDLCTASDEASCSLSASWNEGLKESPSGIMLINTSPWRTLAVHGITFSINCTGGVPCQTEDFIYSNDASGNPIDPNISLLWPTSTPTLTSLDMCDSSGCTVSYDFPFASGFELSPGEAKELQVVSVSNLTNYSLESIQFAMHVAQKLDDGSYVKDSIDYKAESLSWYAAYPHSIGPTYQCNLGGSTGTVDYGCVIPTGCIISLCPGDIDTGDLEDDGSPLYDFCSLKGMDAGDYVCGSKSGSFSNIACTKGGTPSYNTMPPAGPYVIGSNQGAVLSMDVSPLKDALFLDDFPPTFRLNVHKFADNGSGYDCSDGESCQEYCEENFNELFDDLDFYWGKGPGVSISDYGLMCTELYELDNHFAPLTTGVEEVTGVWFEYNTGSFIPRCAATISFWDDPDLQAFVNEEASSSNPLQIGIRSGSATTLEIESPLSSVQDSFSMAAFYKS